MATDFSTRSVVGRPFLLSHENVIALHKPAAYIASYFARGAADCRPCKERSRVSEFETGTALLKAVLRMAVRLYPGGDGTPLLCVPGLTCNAADFEELAPLIAATGRDVAAVSLRGRGPSDYDPNYHNYHPLTYRDDALAALDALGWNEAIFIGTSLGGIVTMLLHRAAPGGVKAAVLNDVGPELAAEGIARITICRGACGRGACGVARGSGRAGQSH